MESPALPDPPYSGRGSISSEGPATSSHSPSRRQSTQTAQSSPGRPSYGVGSTAAYFASSATPQPSYSSLSTQSLTSQSEEGQEYLGNQNNNHYNQQPRSRQTSYDEPNPVQLNTPDNLPPPQQYPTHLTHTHSSTSLSTAASHTASYANAESPCSLQPGAGLSSPIPSTSSAGQEREDELRSGEGLGLGRIAEPVPPPPPEQPRRGSAWLPERHDEDGQVPANFDEGVLRALCDSDVSHPRVCWVVRS